MKHPPIAVIAICIAWTCLAQVEKPDGIPDWIFADPKEMVLDSLYGNSIARRYITDHPERFREPLKEIVAAKEDFGPLFSAALLASGILTDDEFFAVADKALRCLPPNDDALVDEYRTRLVDLVEQRKSEIRGSASAGTLEETRRQQGTSPEETGARHATNTLPSGSQPTLGRPLFVMIAVAALGILVLLIRALLRRRPS